MLLNIINYILYNQEKGYFRKNYDKKNKTNVLYDESGKFRGIKSQGEEAYGKILITEPS